MEWEIFTLEDERLRILGQEISSDIGRKILAALKERPMSPNDLARELELPLTTVVFHIEKLQSAGLIRPVARIAGRRGQKTLYALTSSAFIILPAPSGDKEKLLETLKSSMVVPKELIVRSAITGLLIGILILLPWYFLMTSSYYGLMAPGEEYTAATKTALTRNQSAGNATVAPMVKGPAVTNETGIVGEIQGRRKFEWDHLMFLILGLAASTASAATWQLILWRKLRKRVPLKQG